MSYKKNISDNIRLLMNQKGLRAWSELAKLCGLTVPAMQRLINQETESPGINSLKAIADFFEISVDDLISEDFDRSRSYFAGIFSNGTKTFCCIEDQNGKTLGLSEATSSNIAYSTNITWGSIINAINVAIQNSDLNIDIKTLSVAAGIKGTELSESLTKLIKIGESSFKRFEVYSDGHVSYKAVFQKSQGILVIADEGIVGLSHDGKKEIKMGGWGFPHSDEGSTAWIGSRVLSHVFRVCDRIEKSSDLSQAILTRFDNSSSALCEYVMHHSTPRDFAAFYDVVLDHYNKGNKVAIEIITEAVEIIFQFVEEFDARFQIKLPIYFDGKMRNLLNSKYRQKQRLVHSDVLFGEKARAAIKLLRQID